MLRAALLLAILSATLGSAHAASRAEVEGQFQAWLASDVWPEARAAGVSEASFRRATDGVTLDWDMPELVPPGTTPKPPATEWQAEFGSPGAYFKESNLDALATGGRSRLSKYQTSIAAIEKRYGVPGRILVAIWGKETAFGQVKLPEPAIRALATLGFMGMRKDMFRGELIAALQIVENGDIAPGNMRSSWAGALGQPQFMPSQYLKYAVDFDGDGHRDIWNSVPDTLASIANYLRNEGWNPERGWGLEAIVPDAVACTLEGPEQGKPMGDWAAAGVQPSDGSAFPVRAGRNGFLLMPAGRHGPAFIVTENFYALKQYNYSDLYALYIGHLADRMGDNRTFRAKWQKVGGFSRGDVRAMQDRLVAGGYDVGKADGLVGFKTRVAVGLVQARNGQPPTCFPDAGFVSSTR